MASDSTQNDIEVLQRVLLRFAQMDEERFEQALPQALPNVLPYLTRDNETVRNQVIDILQHVFKRLRSHPSIHLPVQQLLNILNGSTNAYLTNFTLMFLEVAFSSSEATKEDLLQAPELLRRLSSLQSSQQLTVLHTFLSTLSHATIQPEYNVDHQRNAKPYKFLTAKDLKILQDFFLDVLFLTPVSGAERSIGGGLSLTAHKNATKSYKLPQTASSLHPMKKGIVRFVYHSGIFRDNAILPHLLVASKDSSDDVAKMSDTFVKKLTNVDLEELALINRLMNIFLGSEGNKKIKKPDQRKAANPHVKLKLVAWFTRSIKAANRFPLSLKVLFDCLFSKNSFSRLHIAGMEYFCWILNKSSDKQISGPISSILKQGIWKLIRDDADPSKSAAAQQLRGMAYTSIGHLATRKPARKLFVKDLQVAILFFDRLTQEPEALRPNVQEGLSSLCSAYKHMKESLHHEMRVFLTGRLEKSDEKRVRVCALLWMNKLFAFKDVEVRFYCLMNSADRNVQVRNEARRGFAPRMLHDDVFTETKKSDEGEEKTPGISNSALDGLESEKFATYPDFGEFIAFVRDRLLNPAPDQGESLSFDVSPYVYDQILMFAQRCFKQSGKHTETPQNLSSTTSKYFKPYQRLLHEALDKFSGSQADTGNLHITASSILAEIVALDASLIPDYTSPTQVEWITKYLLTTVPGAQLQIAELLKTVSQSYELSTCTALLQQFSRLVLDSKKSSVEDRNQSKAAHGAMFGIGALVESLVITKRVADASGSSETEILVRECTRKIVRELKSSLVEIRSAACKTLGNIGKHIPLPLAPTEAGQEIPYLETSLDTEMGLPQLEKMTPQPATDAKADAMDTEPDLTVTTAVEDLLKISKDCKKHRTVAESAINALGDLAIGDRDTDLLDQIRAGLFGLTRIREEELHFAIGLSLSKIGNDEAEVSSAAEEAPPKKRMKPDSSLNSQMDKITYEILTSLLPEGSAVVRCSACIWLMSLVKHSGKHSVIQAKLANIQHSFALLLAESKKFTQECASKGMAMTYELSPPGTQEDLINNLTKTLGAGKRIISGDTEIKHMEGVSTYKELCGVAAELGQPSLMYKFMDLAANSAIWSSKSGAAFSLGSLAKVHKQLRPRVERLIPKLYRYQYDPDETIRRTMITLWKTLVDDPVKAIEDHFTGIMKEMIGCLENRQWRVRQACTVAVTDIIIGRSYAQIEPHLKLLWRRMFGVLDDVKDTVRNVAKGLARNLMNLTKRLCDPKYSKDDEVDGTLRMLVPFLLKNIAHRAKEVQAVSIQTVVDVTKVAGVHLRPYLADLITSLLQSMSTLEDSAFSYFQFHTAALETTVEKLEELRLAISKASPLSDALNYCMKCVNEETAESVVSAIASIIKSGVGLPTLSASAQFVIRLITLGHREEVRPYCKRLINSFSSGLQDQSPSIRKDYTTALSYVCGIAKQKHVQKVLLEMKGLYLVDISNNSPGRRTAAFTMQAISANASEAMKESSDDILAVVFVGLHDPEKDVAKAWKEVWNDLVAGKLSGIRKCTDQILELVIQLFSSSAYALKKVSLLTVMEMAKVLKQEFPPHFPILFPTLIDGLTGRVWTGKEVLLETFAVIGEECKLGLDNDFVTNSMLSPLLAECVKKNQDYKKQAVESFGRLCVLYPEIDMFEQARLVLGSVVEDDIVMTENTDRKMDDATLNDKQQQRKKNDAFRSKCFFCLGQVFPSASHYETQKAHIDWVLKCFLTGLSRSDWVVRVSILRSLKRLCFCVSLTKSDSKDSVLSSTNCHQLVDAFLFQSKDGRYSAVRLCALEALHELLTRTDVKPVISDDLDTILSRLEVILKEDINPHVLRLTHLSKTAVKQLKKS